MGRLDIDQAARASGLTAREVRELIERGKLPATRPAGRWLIDEQHLAAAQRPEVSGARPIGATTTAVSDEDMSTLLARLEEASAEIAELRTERDELRLRLREQVSSLQRSLEDSMEELDDARAQLSARERRPRPVPAPAAEPEARSEPDSPPEPPSSARDALTPLFRATTDQRDVGRRDD